MYIEEYLQSLEPRMARIESLMQKIATQLDGINAGDSSEDREMTTSEVAEYLNYSRHHIAHLVSSKSIPHYKSANGRTNIFLKSEIDKWRNSRRKLRVSTAEDIRNDVRMQLRGIKLR